MPESDTIAKQPDDLTWMWEYCPRLYATHALYARCKTDRDVVHVLLDSMTDEQVRQVMVVAGLQPAGGER
jgi:hypothetical protein